MRTIEKTIYTFDELSEEIQDKIIENRRVENYNSNPFDYIYDEIDASLDALLDHIGASKNYGGCSSSNVTLSGTYSDEISEFRGKRAMAWLENSVLSDLRAKKGDKYNRINTVKSCPFTGVCYDDDFLEDLTKNIRDGYTVGDCLNWLVDKRDSMIEESIEYLNTYEAIIEEFIANEYEFDENGAMVEPSLKK